MVSVLSSKETRFQAKFSAGQILLIRQTLDVSHEYSAKRRCYNNFTVIVGSFFKQYLS